MVRMNNLFVKIIYCIMQYIKHWNIKKIILPNILRGIMII